MLMLRDYRQGWTVNILEGARVMVLSANFNNNLIIVMVSFIGGGNRSTRRQNH